MVPIAAKCVGRGRPGTAFDLLRSMAGALDRVRLAVARPVADPIGEPWPGLLSTDPWEQLATLRRLCREMARLLPHLGSLDGAGGRLAPEALPQLDRMLDSVQALMQAQRGPAFTSAPPPAR